MWPHIVIVFLNALHIITRKNHTLAVLLLEARISIKQNR